MKKVITVKLYYINTIELYFQTMPNPIQLSEIFIQALSNWPKGRLPSVRFLSKQHHTSTRTVQLAMTILQENGLVESRSKSGFWRKGELPEIKGATAKRNVDSLYQQLSQELKEGLHPWDSPLPLLKELAVQWNCHAQTVAKVMERAVLQRLLDRKGRFHFPARPPVKRKGNRPTILCLGAGAPDGNFRMDSDRESDFWRELGAQAALSGLSLVRCVWNGGRIRPIENTVGIIATNWHYEDPYAICWEIAKLKLPACVWFDEQTRDFMKSKPRIHYHDQGHSTENGVLLTRHLMDLGHKHIAFISPWHANSWSIKRLQGIQEEAMRNGCHIDVCCLHGDSEWDRLIPAENDPMIQKKFPQHLIEKLVEGSSDSVRSHLCSELGWNRIRKDMEPLFAQALASQATAWIGANDICALNALKWLKGKGIQVPRDISVVGFDDTIEALRSDLTSFRFSCASVARSMIHQILTGSKAPTLTQHKGMVVVRGSSARVGSK